MICGAGCNRMTDAVLLSFHPAMPDEPLVFVEVAALSGHPRIPCRKSYGTIGMS